MMIPENVKRAVEHEIRSGFFPGAVLLCGNDSDIIFHEAFGLARVEPEKVSMHGDMIFDVASVTKAVATTTALGICVDDGLLNLEDNVGAYFPAFQRDDKKKITIAQLTYHASGLDNTKFDGHKGDGFFEAALDAPVTAEPDTIFCYSCRGYVLMGMLVEAVTGKRFDDFCNERIFQPLKMKDTRFGPPRDLSRMVATERKTLGEVSDDQARAAGRPVGNAGLFTTAADLAIFARMMLGGGQAKDNGPRVISNAIHSYLTHCASPTHLRERSIGWDLRGTEESPACGSFLSTRAYGHTGWTGQSLWIDPACGFFVVILTNRTHPVFRNDDDATAAARGRIADALIEQFKLNVS